MRGSGPTNDHSSVVSGSSCSATRRWRATQQFGRASPMARGGEIGGAVDDKVHAVAVERIVGEENGKDGRPAGKKLKRRKGGIERAVGDVHVASERGGGGLCLDDGEHVRGFRPGEIIVLDRR